MLNASVEGIKNPGNGYVYLGSIIVYDNDTSDPTSPTPTGGSRYYNSSTNVEKYYNGTSWIVNLKNPVEEQLVIKGFDILLEDSSGNDLANIIADTSNNARFGFNTTAFAGNNSAILGREAGNSASGSGHVMIGYQAGQSSSSFFQSSFIGYQAGVSSSGFFNTYLGATAGGNSSGNQNVILGAACGTNNTGTGIIAAGYQSCGNNSGDYTIGLGHNSGTSVSGDNCICIGREAGRYGTYDDCISIGWNAGDGTISRAHTLHLGTDNVTADGLPFLYGETDTKICRSRGTFETADEATLGSEVLTETDFATHANWNVTGDFTDSTGAAVYTHSTGSGTLTQIAANFNTAVSGNRLYYFQYSVSSVSGDAAASITTGIATESRDLLLSSGAQGIFFHSKASPGDFVLSGTSTSGGFTLDNFSVKEVQGGLINAHGELKGRKVTLVGDTFDATNIKSGTSQANAGASTGEVWADTANNNVLRLGV